MVHGTRLVQALQQGEHGFNLRHRRERNPASPGVPLLSGWRTAQQAIVTRGIEQRKQQFGFFRGNDRALRSLHFDHKRILRFSPGRRIGRGGIWVGLLHALILSRSGKNSRSAVSQ